MTNAYVRAQVLNIIGGDGVVTKHIGSDYQSTAGESFGDVTGELTVTLAFDAAQHKWTDAISAAIVAAAATAGFAVLFLYLQDYESIKP